MSPLAEADPFAVTADPDAYVPRPASEAALAALERAVAEGRGPCALTGPVGIGKSLVLRVLERRLGRVYTFVVLPYAALGLDDIARWALGVLGRRLAPGDDPVAALLAVAERLASGRGALVLMLDDASALAPETARALVGLCGRSGGALRLVVVPVDDGRAGRVLAALGGDAVHVRLREPLGEAETAHFVRERLARAAAPPHVVERFDAETLARLHALSGGNPRRVQILAASVLRGRGLADPLEEGRPWAASAGEEAVDADALETDRDGGPSAGDGREPGDVRAESAARAQARGARAAMAAAAVVLLALALIVLAWWLSPTAGPGDDVSAAGAAHAATPSAEMDADAPPEGAARSTGAGATATP